MPRLVSTLIATTVVAALTASTGTGSTRRLAINDGAQGVSANWSGYTLQDANGAGLEFTSVTGTWRQPVTRCDDGATSSAAFWVGLGGFATATATGLEQTGTGADCIRGVPRYYAWYEILPAASVEVPLKVKPGDLITTSVNVYGTRVLVQIKNRTRKTSFTRAMTVADPDISSAEWIAEAPSACDAGGRCTVLPLANFGTVNFTRAATIATAHPGTIADPTWGSIAISLVPPASQLLASRGSSTAGATPGALSADGRSFGVAWLANVAG